MRKGFAALAAVLLGASTAQAADGLGPATMRRLSADQYRTIIHDVFGPGIELGGYFEPDLRLDGLAAVGASRITVTPADMEHYDAMARSIAAQVVDEKHRAQMVPCAPAAADAPDDVCARTFLSKVGRLLYRRPLSPLQLTAHVKAAHVAAETTHDFYQGLSLSLAAMLASPQFLFREPALEPDPHQPGHARLDTYAKASQLSFFLWNSAPDLPLLQAAEKGQLDSDKGLAREVDRMMRSARLEAGVRAFFVDMFGFDAFAGLIKDPALFPEFSTRVATDAEEQTLKTIVDLLLKQNGDYRDLFTTKKTFLTQELGAIYRVPVISDAPNGAPDSWQPYTFAPDDPRGGILMQVAFTALHSPAGRGSPTLRGKALRELILCQRVPPPPGNVKFDLVNDTANPLYKTARDRLTAHATNPVCAGCHKIMDPLGLALENFDGAGVFRTVENGAAIDVGGVLDGVTFKDPAGLGRAVHDNPATASCAVNRVAAYAIGRVPSAGEAAWIAALQKSFADNGYKFPALMRAIATSPAFTQATGPETKAASTGGAP